MKKLLTILLISVTGCSGLEDFRPEAGLAVKEIAVTKSETVGTRARYDEATRELFWSDGDGYFFYTFGISDVLSDVTVGTLGSASHITEIIPVTYDLSNDNTVVIGSKGSKVGAVSSKTKTDVTITNGIPVVQDGTVEGSYVNLGTANLQTQDEAFLGSRQAYISFNLLTGTVGDRTVKFFTVNGKDGETVCGDATYSIASAAVSAVSGGTDVVVDVTAAAQRNYYVALAPGTYTDGLRICLYDAGTVDSTTGEITGGHICGYVDTKPGIVVTAGRILALGDLTAHKTVPASGTDDCLIVHPSDAHIVKLSDFVQTKKFWIEHDPTDMTDIDFEYSVPGIIEAERGPDEEYNGTNYMTVIVTPICDDITDAAEEHVCTLTVKDRYPAPGTAPSSATCTVTVGMFIDLGLPSGTLWAVSNMVGNKTATVNTLNFSNTVAGSGTYYAWAWTEGRTPDTDISKQWRWLSWSNRWTTDTPKFTAEYEVSKIWQTLTTETTTNQYHMGVKLVSGLYKDEINMKDEDDVCHLLNNAFRIPSETDINELINNSSSVALFEYNGALFYKATSTVAYFDDVHLLVPCSGNTCLNGGVMEYNAAGTFWSSTHVLGNPSAYLHDYGYISEKNQMNWSGQYWSDRSTGIVSKAYRNGKIEECLLWECRPVRAVKLKTPPTP